MTPEPFGTEDSPAGLTGGAEVTEPPQRPSGRPPLWMRVSTFLAVLVAGLLGGTVGGSFARLSCTGDCDLQIGGGILIGSVVAAAGTAIVVRIVLRGADAWALG